MLCSASDPDQGLGDSACRRHHVLQGEIQPCTLLKGQCHTILDHYFFLKIIGLGHI